MLYNLQYLSLFMLAMIVGCAPPMRVVADYDRSANFTQYRSFAWMEQAGTTDENRGFRRPFARKELDEHLINTVNNELIARGFVQASENRAPDILLHYFIT